MDVLLLALRCTVLDRLARTALRYTVGGTFPLPTHGSGESLAMKKEQTEPGQVQIMVNAAAFSAAVGECDAFPGRWGRIRVSREFEIE